jgi:hypothetical protein
MSFSDLKLLGNQSSVISSGGSLYPEYKCRAWVKFVGAGSVTGVVGGNISTVSYNSTGDYIVNFTVAFPDTDYVANAANKQQAVNLGGANFITVKNTGNCRHTFTNFDNAGPSARDQDYVLISYFR